MFATMIRKNIISIIVAITILVLSLSDSDKFESIGISLFPHADKLVHLLMYGTLMLTLLISNRKWISSGVINYIILLLIAFSYGIIIELLQKYLTSDRSGELLDALFNLVGIVLAILAWLLVTKIRKSSLR